MMTERRETAEDGMRGRETAADYGDEKEKRQYQMMERKESTADYGEKRDSCR